MTQDDIFNVFHYLTVWQFALIFLVLALVTYWLAGTKAGWLCFVVPVLTFLMPLYSISVPVAGTALIGVYFLRVWREHQKEEARKAAERAAGKRE